MAEDRDGFKPLRPGEGAVRGLGRLAWQPPGSVGAMAAAGLGRVPWERARSWQRRGWVGCHGRRRGLGSAGAGLGAMVGVMLLDTFAKFKARIVQKELGHAP
jgi:hypothetical protein